MPRLYNSKTAPKRRLERISSYELGRPHARLGNPNTGIPEVIVQPLYDIYFAAAGATLTLLSLFTVPIGQAYALMSVTSFTKQIGHTNLKQAGMLQSSYTFVVRALSVFCMGLQGATHPYLNPEDANNFLSSYFNFNINDKSYFDGIGQWLPGGGGVMGSGSSNGTNANTTSNFSAINGWPMRTNIYPLPGGQYINPQETFNFVINPTLNAGGAPAMLAAVAPSAGFPAAGISAWVRLDGTLCRVAQ